MKLVDHFNLNTNNPYNNPELRFSKKFVDCCEKSNIAYTDSKIKSFITSRVKYQLRADYPEESKGSESNNFQVDQSQKIKTFTNNIKNELISKEKIHEQNNIFISNFSNVNHPISSMSSNFNNINSFSDLAANTFNTNQIENANILFEINEKQMESLKTKTKENADFSANKSKINKKTLNSKNPTMENEEDKIDGGYNLDKERKHFNFINPFVHKDITNNLNNINNSNNTVLSNTINNIASGINIKMF